MKRLRVTTGCLIAWAMIWIHLGEFFLELWIASRWFSRPNLAVEQQPLSHHLWLSSYSSISSPSSCQTLPMDTLNGDVVVKWVVISTNMSNVQDLRGWIYCSWSALRMVYYSCFHLLLCVLLCGL